MKVHNALINILKERTPLGENPVDILTNILPISKEAAYRRLRGEISLTLEEAVRLAQKLGVSLDNIVEVEKDGKYCFHTSLFWPDPIKGYMSTMENMMDLLSDAAKRPGAHYYSAMNVLPFFILKYKSIVKLRLFKWLFKMNSNGKRIHISEVIVPEKILEMHRACYDEFMKIPASLILDSKVIENLVNDLRYFFDLNLVSSEDIEALKIDLHAFINDLELLANTGKYPNGVRLMIYISNVFLDAAYDYIESEDHQVSAINVYGINYFFCDNKDVCAAQKEWIEFLMRYSTLISFSGEKQRMEYFLHQRKLIDSL